jgi:hypothetical protein
MKEKKLRNVLRVRQVTGSVAGVTFTKEYREANDIDVGDDLDMSDVVVIKNKEKKQ